ncbi:hypothetical protein MSG28_008224 [Choristoneura fumiferana]|uniref:Uncharacterized protein n=1 Tax=Choristoneura fumiferana TaxID=7141 RepID=A0ACC0JAH0_CHOFU|nr:hypothetical protein MSG28_008224 [Choristoneura fumiferana]
MDLETLIAYNEASEDEEVEEEENDTDNEELAEIEDDNGDAVALFLQSPRGHTILQYDGHRYRKTYRSKHGVRWNCSTNKRCTAFLYLNDNDEIIMANKTHKHGQPVNENIDADQTDTAVVITSRKGKEMLLFRKYTYRKQYSKVNRTRWVCSTLKNCRACVFTDNNNFITSAFEEHCHNPPKYYLKPDHVLEAIRDPVDE